MILLLIFLFPPESFSFIVGGCIGPKSVLERHLSDQQKSELRKMVHTNFDGSNSDQIIEEVNRYVFGHVTEEQWHSIVPELAEYQAKKHECSLYAQLLPKALFKQLLKSVLRASEMGASKYDVKRLVDDYVERLAKNGVLPDVMDKTPSMPRITLPENQIASQGYRNIQPNRIKKPKPMKKMIVHPTLIEYPDGRRGFSRPTPAFPIARPTSFDLSQYGDREIERERERERLVSPRPRSSRPRTNHRTPQQQLRELQIEFPNFRQFPEHECDYYAGPCATSF